MSPGALVVVFLRGAADGLSLVVPHGEAAYYRQRPSLAIPRPDDRRAAATLRAIDLDGFFGLHPALRPLLPAWRAGHLAAVHACGAPDESRSHFRAQELIERGVDDETGPASGWIGRLLAAGADGSPSPLRALALGPLAPLSLRGPAPVTALRSLADLRLGDDPAAVAGLRRALRPLYAADRTLGPVGLATLDLLDSLERLDDAAGRPAGGPDYPATDFGRGLRTLARLIEAEVGLEAAAIDLGGWDTHFLQGGSEGALADLVAELGRGLGAFHADLAGRLDRWTVVVQSEFGRRVAENASLGTDHGHGGVMLALGGRVAGGRVHGAWPGLEAGQLFGPGDLAATTDYRDVLAEICARVAPERDLAAIFPGFRPRPVGAAA